MSRPGLAWVLLTSALVAPRLAAAEAAAPVCRLLLHEASVERADLELEVDVERSNVAAFTRIAELIQKLWDRQAIDRMSYLRAKYDRDAAELALERAGILLERQRALVDQYALACGDATGGPAALEDARRRYLRADCDEQAKAVEVARVNLEFRREWLTSVRDLRAGDVATAQDVILAELDVEREEKRLADATARTARCRGGDAPARP